MRGRLVSLLEFFRVTRFAKSERLSAFHGSSKPGNRSFGRFSRPLLEGYFSNRIQACSKGKSLAVAEIFRYCKGFFLSYSYFCLLDQKYKRGLLREVFSQIGANCEKRNLKDISMLFADGDWIESKDQSSNGIRLIQTGNIGFGVYLDKPKNAKYISEETFHRLNCLEVCSGDILVSRLPEPAGRACLLPQSKEKRITAVDCTVIRADKSVIDTNYLLQFLCSEQYLQTVNAFLAGGTRQRISRKNLETIQIPCPSLDKQQYLGSFLCTLDDHITNSEKHLSCLNRMRCFMLQQLFI